MIIYCMSCILNFPYGGLIKVHLILSYCVCPYQINQEQIILLQYNALLKTKPLVFFIFLLTTFWWEQFFLRWLRQHFWLWRRESPVWVLTVRLAAADPHHHFCWQSLRRFARRRFVCINCGFSRRAAASLLWTGEMCLGQKHRSAEVKSFSQNNTLRERLVFSCFLSKNMWIIIWRNSARWHSADNLWGKKSAKSSCLLRICSTIWGKKVEHNLTLLIQKWL